MTDDIKAVGVIGAGQMGIGIAHVCAVSGYEVKLIDIADEAITKAMVTIEKNLSRLVAKGKLSVEEQTSAMNLITAETDYESLKDVDLVIEAATENEEVKTKIFEKICPMLRDDTILSTNTSSISITRLAASTDRPEHFIGLHFMNPAPLMELIELIRGIATDVDTFATVKNFVTSLSKIPVSAEDFPAFIVNRILIPMINEAVYTLYEGVGTVEAIDNSMKLGAHHPMGPLELADFIGLDTCLSIMQVLHDGLADTKYRPCPLLVKYVEAGWLGRKSGRGFYDYSGEKPEPTR
ncbi:MAG: 3-hydroxybutyryl-CoA dehydrogenase [Rhodospirillaceae bacterium]|nr:3-hydroxybutyryl-CoA dehydrogenase [Rhodospirillaceae bacterium]